MAYDERHGYRGPIARVELPGAAEGADAAGADGNRLREQLRALLDDYPTLLDYESAIVLRADDAQRARCFSRRTASRRSASTPSSGPSRSSPTT